MSFVALRLRSRVLSGAYGKDGEAWTSRSRRERPRQSSSSNCRNQPRYPVLAWGVMHLEYAGTGRIVGRIAAGVCIFS
jgi:hypothetical protein